MRFVVPTGTDVAAVAVGDPSLLEPLRERKGRGFEAARDDAVASGALWRIETGADGSYLFHIHVDEPAPEVLAPYLSDPLVVERLRIPSGRLLVAGEECFVGALDPHAHPRMGAEIEVPPGEYRLTAMGSDAADALLDERFAAQATPHQRRAWLLFNWLGALCVLATLGSLAAAYFVFHRTSSLGISVLPLLAAAMCWSGRAWFLRCHDYVGAEKLYRGIEMELPSIVVLLAKREAGERARPDTVGDGQ